TLEVQVVSLDWKWLFIYPQQGFATVNQLVVPAGAPVHFSITSGSVFNTFFVPRLGSMIYAMPGMVSQLYLQADRPAVLLGESAQFSGDGFSDMQFQVRSVPADQFATWAQSAKASSLRLDRGAYDQLARQSQNVKPFTYGSIDPQLFHAVSLQQVPPGPGPEAAAASRAGRDVATGGRR
ncbi:MAG: cytochrome ubiquinol oxidase subunit II, partial [Proteobacteria bacterium]|nr:cytochrome ubiquinol oxidase subunit II [Pseudomonadota bacterium]